MEPLSTEPLKEKKRRVKILFSTKAQWKLWRELEMLGDSCSGIELEVT